MEKKLNLALSVKVEGCNVSLGLFETVKPSDNPYRGLDRTYSIYWHNGRGEIGDKAEPIQTFGDYELARRYMLAFRDGYQSRVTDQGA